ncbi:MAG: PilT/PilU family type 4a pilus ATPase [Planctomycetota bacterium]
MRLQDLLQKLLDLDGTDLYVTVGAPPKISVESEFVDAAETSCTREDLEGLVAPLLPDRAAFDARPERDLAWRLGDAGRFRVNVFKQRGELALVARRIRVGIRTLDDLGMPPVLKEMALARQGLVLVTGATGSGKSTTLAAMIDHRNASRGGHVVTIEDPIEFMHEHKRSLVSQREVGVDTACFADALKSALRQAPDVLLVGEVRDRETADAALHFAETGHLVFATLHSTNANQTLERLLGLFPGELHAQVQLLLSLNLRGIVSQRLVPAKSGKRRAALEILLPTARVRDLLRKGAIEELKGAIAEGAKEGMITFDQCLHDLYREGAISLEDALAYADSATDLRLKTSLKAGRAPDAGIRVV